MGRMPPMTVTATVNSGVPDIAAPAVTAMPDHFELLGLLRRFAIDPQRLEQAYIQRSRAVHPDYYSTGQDAQRQASLELSAALNEAYAVLRDPFRRADYLLQLLGGPTASEYKQIPPEFLAEMLELREQIEHAQNRPELRQQLDQELQQRWDQLVQQIAQAFAVCESTPLPPETGRQIRTLLNAAQYIRGLRRDLHGTSH